MRRPTVTALALCLLLAAAALLAACGSSEEELEVVEGEPVEVGGLSYNVGVTRFLNPEDAEDRAYLADQPPAPKDMAYLGVFMQIENESDTEREVSGEFEIVDTRERQFEPIPSTSAFALEPDTAIPPGGVLPAPDSAAASGPIKGAMVLFLVDEDVSESRPLSLEIPAAGGPGASVELDI